MQKYILLVEEQNYIVFFDYLCRGLTAGMKRLILPNQAFFELAEQMLRQGKKVEITVKGQSMRPFLLNGEKVTVVPVSSPGELQKGTIILAKTLHGVTLLHRIHEVEDNLILMKGDGNIDQTEPVLPTDVLGIVSSIHRNGREISPYTLPRRIGAKIWRNRLIRRIGLRLYRYIVTTR